MVVGGCLIAARPCSIRARTHEGIYSDRVRSHPRVLYGPVGARDHARLLASRQLRRRSGSLWWRACICGRALPPPTAAWCRFPGKTLRALVTQIPGLAIGLIEGLTFKGKCYSGLAQMLGTRSHHRAPVHCRVAPTMVGEVGMVKAAPIRIRPRP